MFLTDVKNGKIWVNPKLIRLVEVLADGTTHVVFDGSMGRIVTDSFASIIAILGAGNAQG